MLQKLAPVLSKMGSGYNSLTDEVIGEGCVTGTIIPPDPAGSSVTYQMEFVTSLDQFSRATSVEASVSGSFGAFSASVKSEFEQSQQTNSTSTHLLVREYVQTSEINLNNPRLKAGKTLELLASIKDPKQFDIFMRTCGDQYVSTAYMGGEFIALLSSDSSDEELKKSVKISGSASYGTFSSSASFSDKVSSFKSKSNLSVKMTRIGGSGDLPVITVQGSGAVDAILDYASKLPSNVSQYPVMYKVKGRPYTQIGVALPEPDAAKAVFTKLQATEDKLGTAIIDLKLAQKSYDLLGIPGVQGPNDIRHVTQTKLAAAEADQAALSPILQSCGKFFWVAHSCDAPARFLNYAAPAPPLVIVQNIPTNSSNTVSVYLPVKMKAILRGMYCYDGNNTDHCLPDGAFQPWKTFTAYVDLNGTNNGHYVGQEVDGGPGNFNVTVHDDGYGDNWGDLNFIAYEAN
jgi:hypothetical protein